MKKTIIYTFLLILTALFSSCSSKSWRDASRKSAGIAPAPKDLSESIVQIYYARAFSWRGYFAVHPWVSWKKTDEKSYTVAQVTSWNLRRSNSAISVSQDIPDRYWFDSEPTLLYEARGDKADKVIGQIKELIKTYPYKDEYVVYPGPNSNTFVSYLMRHIDEIRVPLPSHAIGKDFLDTPFDIGASSSGTGFQFSLYGLLGLTMGLEEGIELNIIGLNFGVDFWTPAISLPFIGRLGVKDSSFSDE